MTNYKCHICDNIFDNSLGFKYCPYCGNALPTTSRPPCGCFYPVKVVVGWSGPNTPIFETKYECWGTKGRLYCSCGGDPSKCDFYPEKRGDWDA